MPFVILKAALPLGGPDRPAAMNLPVRKSLSTLPEPGVDLKPALASN
ncbi:MAG: hypothetical protein ACOX7N_10355 [Lawsonibacter sp.]|jgi:hypothetical protein